MTFNDIIKDIKAKKFNTVYLLHGEESYFIDAISDLLEKSVLKENEKAFNMSILYGGEVETRSIIDTANQYPMMSEYRLIIIKESQMLKQVDQLLSYVNAPNPKTVLVLCHKHKKVDGRKQVYKAIKSNKDQIFFESKKIYENKVSSWISNRTKELGYPIEPKASHLIAEYLGTDLSKISNELDKLIIHVEKGNTINQKHVQEHIGISKDYNVFEFQKVIGQRDLVRSLRIVYYFSENPKAAPLPMVTASLFGYLSKLMMTKMNTTKSNQELASIIGGSPYFMQEYKDCARNYSLEELKLSIDHLEQLDLKSKGMGSKNTSYKGLLQEFIYNVVGQ